MSTDFENQLPDLSRPLRVKPTHKGSTFMIGDLENTPGPQKHTVIQWGALCLETGAVYFVVDDKQEAEDECAGNEGCIIIELKGEYFT